MYENKVVRRIICMITDQVIKFKSISKIGSRCNENSLLYFVVLGTYASGTGVIFFDVSLLFIE